MRDCFLQQLVKREKNAKPCGFEWTDRSGEDHKCCRDFPEHRAQHRCLCGASRHAGERPRTGSKQRSLP